jgi:hypothetical protein
MQWPNLIAGMLWFTLCRGMMVSHEHALWMEFLLFGSMQQKYVMASHDVVWASEWFDV